MASACSTTPAHAHGHGHSIHTIDGKVNVNVDIEVNANADVSLSLFQTDNRNHEHDNDEVSHERHINIHTTSTPRAGTVTVTGDCGDQVTGSESINCSLANSHGRCNSNIGQLQGDHECECANESRLPEQTASAIAPLSTQTSTDCMGTTSTSTRTGSTIIIDNDKENGAISISTCMNTDNAMNIDNDIDCHSRARQEATATSTSTAATNMPANANPINTGIDINTNTDTSSPSRPGTRTRTSPAKSRHRVRLLTTQDNHNLHRSVSSSSSDDTNLNDNVVQTTTRSNATDHAITATTTATATANYSFNISNRISATSYQANDPSEDRYASLTNVLLQESNANTSESNQEDLESNQHQAQAQLGPIRMSLFAVLDGHGGPAVAEYASRKLLPLLVQRISDTLDCDVVQPGLFQVNGQTVSVPLRVDGRNTCTRTRTRTRACSGDGLDSDVDISDSEEEDSDEEEDWYKAPDILPSRTDPCSLSSSSQSQSQSQSPSRGFTIGTHTIQERNAITQAIQESYLQFDEEWMNAISRKGKRQTFLVHNGKWNSGACCLVNVVLQRMDMNMNMSANANADDGSAMGMNMGMNMGGEEHEAILYSSHTGDCRAVLLSGDSTSGADADGEAISDDLSFHNSSSDSDDDDEDDNAGDGDESENYVPLNRMLFQRIKGGKRPLLNPFNTNQRFQRRRMWNQCDVGGGSGNSLMDLEQADSPARIESLRQQHHHMQGSEDGNDDGIGNGKGNGLHSHSISNVMIRMCSRSPSPMEFPPQPTPMPKLLHATTLTEDHTPYNAREASLVRERCSYAPRAIAASTNGGIKRVAGSLSVTRALGDAYLKTPMLSFEPYKAHAPYISAMPEVSSRILTGDDRILILASDGVWERVDGDKMAQWVGDYYRKRKGGSGSSSGRSSPSGSVESYRSGARPTLSRRMRMLPTRKSLSTVEQEAVNARILNMTNVSDMVVAKVLNRVRRKYKMANLSSLMDLPKGTSRRMKHDDITTLVVDLEGFIM